MGNELSLPSLVDAGYDVSTLHPKTLSHTVGVHLAYDALAHPRISFFSCQGESESTFSKRHLRMIGKAVFNIVFPRREWRFSPKDSTAATLLPNVRPMGCYLNSTSMR